MKTVVVMYRRPQDRSKSISELRRRGLIGLCFVGGFVCAGRSTAWADEPVTFEQHIAPIFAAKCQQCHGEKTHKAELDLRTPEGILRGGDSGSAIVPHKPEESLLYEYLRDGVMPPEEIKGVEKRPTKDEIETVRRWIAAGAPVAKGYNAANESGAVTHDQILPIMLLRCTVCHGRHKQEAGLDLRTRESMLAGGRSGPAIVPGKADASLLVERIRHGEMPPRRKLSAFSIKPVEAGELKLIEQWIAAGAPPGTGEEDVATTKPDTLVSDEDRKFWAFQPPKPVTPPHLIRGEPAAKAGAVRNAIDAFVLEKLQAAGLSFAPEADLRTVVRRAFFDLTGLPPTPEEMDSVLNDPDPRAYEKLIDRLLDSPHYGERWGSYWLDLAGYSDSEGKTNQDLERPWAWRYRDNVIRAFNSDKPYDRFLLEQLAGDELADYESAPEITPEIYDNLVATGFLRMAPDGTWANPTNFAQDRLAHISDELQVLGSSVMGLTIHCAKCHSHKFDPIPQRDYYRLAAVFKPALDEYDWLRPNRREDHAEAAHPLEAMRYLTQVLPQEIAPVKAHNAPIESRIADLLREREQLAREVRERKLNERLSAIPESDRRTLTAALATSPADRDAKQRMWIDAMSERLELDEEVLRLDADYRQQADQLDKQIGELRGTLKPLPMIRALWDRGHPSPTYILRRGEPTQPTRRVGPGVPSVLTDGRTPFDVQPPWPGAKTTGRRLAFARWLVSPDHPLTARVMVNRIWFHHFGHGIVATLDNFGKTGTRPTHPELLDWLAKEFVDSGWSIKAMHRLMMTSTTYRQSSKSSDAQRTLDPQNQLFSRMPLRRLGAEEIRDSMLLVAGRLDETPFGPPDRVRTRPDGLVTIRETERGYRRSIYALHRRTELPTLLESFDLPQMAPNCTHRSSSTVPTQALQLLNDAQIHDLARQFAERVRRDAGNDPQRQVERAIDLALNRSPTPSEATLAQTALAKLLRQWSTEMDSEELTLEASAVHWVRESEPDKVRENDLLSVWSSTSEDGARRYGLVEFDVDKRPALRWKHAHLELGVVDHDPLRQYAALIPQGIAEMTWRRFHAEKMAAATPLAGLGAFDLPRGTPSGGYVSSQPATAEDLRKLAATAETGRVTFVFMAHEDGKVYRRDWDDGVGRGTSARKPRLVIRFGNVDPEKIAVRALTNFCHALLNSAEFVYVD